MKSNQEAIATHRSLWSKLTASLLSASSLCHTRLVRSLGNLHVVAGDRDAMICEPCGSHRDTTSATANAGTLINLNMAHLQASSLRLALSHIETWAAFAQKQKFIFYWSVFFAHMFPTLFKQDKSYLNCFSSVLAAIAWADLFWRSLHWCLCKSSQNPKAQCSPSFSF